MAETIVFPGDFIANQEEFLAGNGTFAQDGEVKAAAVGVVEKDLAKRAVRVKRAKLPVNIERGMVMLGRAKQVSEKTAIISIMPARLNSHRVSAPQGYGILRVTEVKQGFVKSLENELKIGDFVMVKVIEVSPHTILLSIKAPELGVVKAYCAKCRHALVSDGKNLKCQNCGMSGTRKLSTSYGKGVC